MSALPKINLSQILGPNGKFVQNWCETEPEIHEVDYVWVIHNYNFYKANLSKDDVLKSPMFNAATNEECKWYLELFPNGKNDATNTNDSALYLHLATSSDNESVMAELKVSLLDRNQKEVNVLGDGTVKKFQLRTIRSNWGFRNFIPTDYVLPSIDKLTIYCKIKFSVLNQTNNAFNKLNSSKVPQEFNLSHDFRQLLNNEESSDVVISVNQKTFKVHKLILSTRSPVFTAMFAHKEMKESRENKIIITDFDEQIVEEMLKFIYTDKSENLNLWADKLLMIADKYQLKGLAHISERALIKNLSVKNAVDVLLFADFHGFHKLKSEIIDFIAKKSAKVMKTTAWENIESHPHLVIEICKALSSLK